MKAFRYILPGVVTALAMALSPRATADVSVNIPGIHINVHHPQDKERIDVHEGETFALALPAGRLPDYQWQLESTPGHEVRYAGVQRCTPEVAAPGEPQEGPAPTCDERWTFRAVDEGSTTIRFKYARPDDPDHPADRVAFKVKVHD